MGKHAVVYTSPDGCVTIDTIDIIEFEEADVRGIENVYCFQDTVVDFVFSPPGGTLTINGIVSMPQFNPSVLGPGSHEVLYTSGSGDCESSKRLFFTVLFPIEGKAVASEDSICLGENVVISIQPTGGRGILEPTWNQGLGFGNSHIIFPESSDYYTVVVTDGCSDDLIDSVEVYVYPEFDVDVAQGPEVCFEEETYAEIQPPNDGKLSIIWEDGSRDPRLYGSPGVYDALIIQENSGCELEIEVVLPGAPPIKANFNTIPNGGCIDIIDNELRIIDLATGYTEGTMDFGDTSGVLDLLFDELVHYYNTAGEFTITQIVTNELGCTDTLQKVVCVESRTEVYIPNAFTPNDDDENDVLKLNLLGVDRAEWKIFDRFGEIVFSSNDKDATWDGTMDGQRLHNGVYILYVEYYKDGSDFPLRHTQSVTLLR